MSRANVWNEGAIVWGKSNADGFHELAILVHVDNGGTVVIQQEDAAIVTNRESLPDLIAELRRIHKGGAQ
jgi:hypothetical protein